MCLTEGRTTAGTIVDHINPHKGDHNLFWDKTNWRTVCKKHHDQATALYDGGFGRVLKRGIKDINDIK